MRFGSRPSVEEADVAATVAALRDDPDAILVDVREPEEWSEGHAPDARHIPMRQIPEQLEALPRTAPIYLICRSGNRSETVAAFLKRSGFERPINVKGGMLAWERAGQPVDR